MSREYTHDFWTRIRALNAHIHALTKYAWGRGPLPTPDPELAEAIVQSYHLLEQENSQLRAENGALLAGAPAEFLASLPALDRWCELVLGDKRQLPLVRAAAWEWRAMQYTRDGDHASATIALHHADAAVTPRTRSTAA